MRCSIQNLSFTYDGSSEAVFPGWSVELDTSWRLGLTGRNGRGKTTLLRLMMGELPHGGQISLPMQPVYFPYPVSDPEDMTLNVMQEAAGGEPEWKLLKELRLLEVTEDALYRPFSTLSRGEQTKGAALRPVRPGGYLSPDRRAHQSFGSGGPGDGGCLSAEEKGFYSGFSRQGFSGWLHRSRAFHQQSGYCCPQGKFFRLAGG